MRDKSGFSIRAISRSVWTFLGSVRVFFWLVLVVSLLSLIGVFILQKGPPWAYETLYGEGGARFVFALGLDDIFHTPYFIALVAWAAFSLFACAVNRLRTAWKSKGSVNRDFAAQRTLKLPGEPKQFLNGIQGRLKRGGWRVTDLGEGAVYASRGGWAWWGSPTLHLGVVLLLLAGMVKLTTGESAYLVLYENQSQLLPPRLESELEVTATGFDTVIDPNSGRVLTYYTDLTAGDEDGLETSRIEVNIPYYRDGLTFYQAFVDEIEPALLLIGSRGEISSYVEERLAFEGAPVLVESIAVRLSPTGAEPAAEQADFVELEVTGEPVPYPGTPWSVLVRNYYPNHKLGSEPGVDLNTNPEPNPAMRLDLYLEGAPVVENALVYRLHPDYVDPKLLSAGVSIELGAVRWSRNPEPVLPAGVNLYKLFPGEPAEELDGTWFRLPDGSPALFEVDPPHGLKLTTPGEEIVLEAPVSAGGEHILPLGSDAVGYLNAEAEPITGLEVKRDPGLPFFWAASVLIILGSCLVFAVPWQRIWLRLEDKTVALRTRRLPESELRRIFVPEGGDLS